ncbi:MAG: hypothetical protein HY871_01285 [Chloroflexi bacterium]|nr:hypothetical protein [Chloroflexota bacterium]
MYNPGRPNIPGRCRIPSLFSQAQAAFNDFPRQFWVLVGGTLINAIGGGLIFPFLTLYARHRLGIPMTTVGLLLALNSAAGLAPQLAAGSLADIAPEAMRGRYMGVFGLVWAMGYGLGPVTGGLIMDRLGGFYIWPATLVLCALAAVAFLAMGRAVDQRM